MIWFNYVETVLLPLIIVAEIVALVVSSQQRNRIRNKHQMYLITVLCVSLRLREVTWDRKCYYVVLYSYIFQSHPLLYHGTINNKLVFSVPFEYQIQCRVVAYKTFKNTYMHLCHCFFHFYLLCILDRFKVD